MTRRLIALVSVFVLVFGWFWAFAGEGGKATSASERKNILFVLVDDMRTDELEAMTFNDDGSWIEYTNATVEIPMCCPSRASILKGVYASDTGVTGNKLGHLMDDRTTVATAMQDVGYRTGLIGKYLNTYPFGSEGGSKQGNRYVPPGWDFWRANGFYLTNQEQSGYNADWRSSRTIDFINETPADTPFFMYLSFNQPHLPANPAPRHKNTPVELAPWPENFNEQDVSDKPGRIRKMPLASQSKINTWISQRTQKARSLMSVDEGVNSIVGALRSSGRLDDTIIVFTSDNGYGFGSHRTEGKGFVYEEQVKVPFLVRVPGVMGRTEDAPVNFVDLAPTFASIAGRSFSPTRGTDFSPTFYDQTYDFPIKWRYIEGSDGFRYKAVRSNQYKYVQWTNSKEIELYDLSRDPFEMQNVAKSSAYTDVLTEAKAALQAASQPLGQ